VHLGQPRDGVPDGVPGDAVLLPQIMLSGHLALQAADLDLSAQVFGDLQIHGLLSHAWHILFRAVS
jgi:hypothetical protein